MTGFQLEGCRMQIGQQDSHCYTQHSTHYANRQGHCGGFYGTPYEPLAQLVQPRCPSLPIPELARTVLGKQLNCLALGLPFCDFILGADADSGQVKLGRYKPLKEPKVVPRLAAKQFGGRRKMVPCCASFARPVTPAHEPK